MLLINSNPRSRYHRAAIGGGGGGATPLFYDDFSSGDLSKTEGGVSWEANGGIPVITGIGPASTTNYLEFSQGDELRFMLGAIYPEVWMQFYVYHPTGLEIPSMGPRWERTAAGNNKIFRLFGLTDLGDPHTEVYPRMGSSSYPTTPSGDEDINAEAGIFGSGSTSEIGSRMTPWCTDATRGTWLKYLVRCKPSTSGANGEYQTWINDDDKGTITGLDTNSDATAIGGFAGGYLFGYLNGNATDPLANRYLGAFSIYITDPT